MSEQILEGFLCPLCMKDLGDVIQLQVRYKYVIFSDRYPVGTLPQKRYLLTKVFNSIIYSFYFYKEMTGFQKLPQ